jgi:hypothetical protein
MKKLLTVLLSLFVLAVQAQESKNSEPKTTSDSALVMLTTNSGENFVGYLVSEDQREVTIRLIDSNKLLSIPAYTVKSIKAATKDNVIKGKVIYPNPHPSRYFYTPSALPMDKGEIYIRLLCRFSGTNWNNRQVFFGCHHHHCGYTIGPDYQVLLPY